MYSKFLFVGLGGAGGETLARLKQEIVGWLEEHQLPPVIPDGWQFLHIDTPTRCDTTPRVAEGEYLGLIDHGIDYHTILGTLHNDSDLHLELQNWQPPSQGIGVAVATGAGQYRAVGSTIAYSAVRTIRNKITRVIENLNHGEVNSRLGELYEHVTGEKSEGDPNSYAIVVSSLAGGTGAGLLMTVCDVIRGTFGEENEGILGVLYTPEVFSTLRLL